MRSRTFRLELRVHPSFARWSLAAIIVAAMGGALHSESVTLSTYYPAPSGVYTQLIATGNSYLARDSGSLGVGTSAPTAKLHVQGSMRLADGSQAAGRVLTSDAAGLAKWESPSSSIVTSVEYNCDAARGQNRNCAIGTHKACFLTAANGTGNNKNHCIVAGAPGGVFTIQSWNEDDSYEIFCRARCLD